MTNAALEGGVRLHAFLGLLPSIDDHQLEELIHATKPDGPEPDELTYRCAVKFKEFKASISTITVSCLSHQKPGFVPPLASSNSSH